MATKKRKAKRRKLAGDGVYFGFHGSFTSREKAEKRARSRGGFYLSRAIPGMGRRYVVMVKKESPF